MKTLQNNNMDYILMDFIRIISQFTDAAGIMINKINSARDIADISNLRPEFKKFLYLINEYKKIKNITNKLNPVLYKNILATGEDLSLSKPQIITCMKYIKNIWKD